MKSGIPMILTLDGLWLQEADTTGQKMFSVIAQCYTGMLSGVVSVRSGSSSSLASHSLPRSRDAVVRP